MTKEKKATSILKIILIFSLIFIVIPLSTVTILYLSNHTFKNATNEFLKTMPGFVGDHFSQYPTETEKEDKKRYLASYYLKLDTKVAADKIYIVKKNDGLLFNDIVKYMNGTSPNRTVKIIKQVRDIELRKDLLFSIYNEIVDEQASDFENRVKEIEGMEIPMAVEAIRNIVSRSQNDGALILEAMEEEKSSRILFSLTELEQEKLLTAMSLEKQSEMKLQLKNIALKKEDLRRLSQSYEEKDAQKAYLELGNTDTYTIDELATIFLNLSTKKAAEILVYVKDETFVEEIFTQIRKQEELDSDLTQSKTITIRKTMKYLNDYWNSIEELVSVYEKMKPEDVADIAAKMIISDSVVSLFNIDENHQYEVSDASIILDVLKKMNKSKLSAMLNVMDARKAAEITRKLAIP